MSLQIFADFCLPLSLVKVARSPSLLELESKQNTISGSNSWKIGMLKDPLLVLNILQIMNNMFLCAMECGADHPYTASFNPYNQPHLELLTPTHSIHISAAWWGHRVFATSSARAPQSWPFLLL